MKVGWQKVRNVELPAARLQCFAVKQQHASFFKVEFGVC